MILEPIGLQVSLSSILAYKQIIKDIPWNNIKFERELSDICMEIFSQFPKNDLFTFPSENVIFGTK